jgi:hypothetical protein
VSSEDENENKTENGGGDDGTRTERGSERASWEAGARDEEVEVLRSTWMTWD